MSHRTYVPSIRLGPGRLIASLLALLALTGCGSGGGTPTEPGAPPTAETTPAPAPTTNQSVQFQGRVTASSASGRRLDLASGTVVLVRSDTVFDGAGDLFTAREIAVAMEAGRRVRVEGDGVSRSDGRIRAIGLKAETD